MASSSSQRKVFPEKISLAKHEQELWGRLGSFWRSLIHEPRPKLTATIRIALMVVAVGVAIGFELTIQISPSRQSRKFPLVVYKVVASESLEWDELSVVCDPIRTPGGDCETFIKQYAGLIVYGDSEHLPNEDTRLEIGTRFYSSTSTIIPSLPMQIISALTLRAFDGTPYLGVVFDYAANHEVNLAWSARHDMLPMMAGALASSVLVNAGFHPIVYMVTDTGDPPCIASYIGGTGSEKRLGLEERCLTSTCNWTDFDKSSKGKTCFNSECENKELRKNGLRLGLGFGHCWKSNTDSPYFPGAISYLLFSFVVAAMATPLTLTFVYAKFRTHLNTVALRQLPGVWPALHRLAVEQHCPIEFIVHQQTSIFMCLECSATGDAVKLARSFSCLQEGVQGAAIHICFVILAVLPLHAFTSNWMAPQADDYKTYLWIFNAIFIFHYSIQLAYAIAYYLRALPFHWRRGLLTWLYIQCTCLVFCVSVCTMWMIILWMFSAIYLNQTYVVGVLTFVGSIGAFIANACSVIQMYTMKVQQKIENLHNEAQRALIETDTAVTSAMEAGVEIQAATYRKGQQVLEGIENFTEGAWMPKGLDAKAEAWRRGQHVPDPDQVFAEQEVVDVNWNTSGMNFDLRKVAQARNSTDGETQHLAGLNRNINDVVITAQNQVQGFVGDTKEYVRGAEHQVKECIDDANDYVRGAEEQVRGLVSDVEDHLHGAHKQVNDVLQKTNEVVDMAERGAEEIMKKTRELEQQLKDIGITGQKLFRTLVFSAILVVLSGTFVLLGHQQWAGGASSEYSPTNLLAPLVAYLSSRKAEGDLREADDDTKETKKSPRARDAEAVRHE